MSVAGAAQRSAIPYAAKGSAPNAGKGNW